MGKVGSETHRGIHRVDSKMHCWNKCGHPSSSFATSRAAGRGGGSGILKYRPTPAPTPEFKELWKGGGGGGRILKNTPRPRIYGVVPGGGNPLVHPPPPLNSSIFSPRSTPPCPCHPKFRDGECEALSTPPPPPQSFLPSYKHNFSTFWVTWAVCL